MKLIRIVLIAMVVMAGMAASLAPIYTGNPTSSAQAALLLHYAPPGDCSNGGC